MQPQSTAQPVLLSAWSVTTTVQDWLQLPADIRKSTAKAAAKLPYKDSTRSRWEAQRTLGKVSAA